MGRKRARQAAGWDELAWKAIDVQLEQDDGWGDGGEAGEACLFGALEEIDGDAYAIEKDCSGSARLVIKKPKPTEDSAEQEGAAAQQQQGAVAAEQAAQQTDGAAALRTKKKGKRKAQQQQAQQLAATDSGSAANAAAPAAAAKPVKGKAARAAAAAAAAAVEAAAVVEEAPAADDGHDSGGGEGGDGVSGAAAADAPKHPPKGTGKNYKKNQRKKQNKLMREQGGAAADGTAAASGTEDASAVPPPVAPAKTKKATAKAAAKGGSKRTARGAAAAAAAAGEGAQGTSPPAARTAAAGGNGGDGGQSEELSDKEMKAVAQWVALGAALHPALLRALARLGFNSPTAIQRATLAKATLGRRDIVGAAETGSGKTLAYGLPLLTGVLRERDQARAAAADEGGGEGGKGEEQGGKLQALVLCPTRELALQVTRHLTAVSEGTGVGIVCVVGGLAEVKQARLLRRAPAVVVATPGRLWEMRATEPHLRDLSGLRFLVIDEADRMCEKGRFDELGKLMHAINPPEDPPPGTATNHKQRSKKQRRGALPDAPMLDESWLHKEGWLAPPGGEQGEEQGEGEGEGGEGGDGAQQQRREQQQRAQQQRQRRRRQVFIFSATLGMDNSAVGGSSAQGRKRRRGGNSGGGGADGLEDNLRRIAELVGLAEKPATVDLSRAKVGAVAAEVAAEQEGDGDEAPAQQEETAAERPLPALPEGLSLAQCKSLQMDKDAWLYYFISQFPGRTLVFVNAVAMARRAAALLRTLRVPAAPLHAQMAQRARLRALDFLRDAPRAVVIATDVAARGLDIPSVDHVVHYDAPRGAADFVHRSGRTARAGAGGFALAIISPRDTGAWTRVFAALGYPAGLPPLPCDARVLDRARERALLAARVVRCEAARGKAGATRTMLTSLAEEAGVIADDEALAMADAEAGGGRGGAEAARVAADADRALAAALDKPLFKDRRKLLPVAEKIAEAAADARRTAAGAVKEGGAVRTCAMALGGGGAVRGRRGRRG